jgi:putative oxidoreductase
MNRQLAVGMPGTTRSKLERWAAFPLRVIIGYGFIAHGYAKIVRGPMSFIDTLHALGMPAPGLMGWATIVVELVGGLAVLIGAFLPLVSIPLAAILLVATFTVHLPYGFSSIKLQSVTSAGPQFGKPGYEVDLLYLAGLATLVLGGSGPVAVDGLLDRAGDKRESGRHSLG